jgi:hypothetical protein
MSEFWIGLFETSDRYLAINQAIEANRARGGLSLTTKDLNVQPITQSELVKVRTAHELEQSYFKAIQTSNLAETPEGRDSWLAIAKDLLTQIRGI